MYSILQEINTDMDRRAAEAIGNMEKDVRGKQFS
jgi:hypothetical protein